MTLLIGLAFLHFYQMHRSTHTQPWLGPGIIRAKKKPKRLIKAFTHGRIYVGGTSDQVILMFDLLLPQLIIVDYSAVGPRAT
ncbi:MAG: hypothetical protein CMQ05_02555 [Gammaproteobacteria bacterium]|nr:hypothetical protein [Gammaproteobacteria bacterium]